MYAAYTDHTHTYYEITLSLDDVRLAYIFKLEQSGHTYYFSEDGLTTSYDFSNGFYNFFQMPYINAVDVHQTVPWVHDAVFIRSLLIAFIVVTLKRTIAILIWLGWIGQLLIALPEGI